MAASHIIKKQAKRQARKIAEQQVIDELLDYYLAHWGRHELSGMIKQGEIVLLPIGPNAYQIGRFRLLHTHRTWEVQDTFNDKTFIFINKHAAVFYCLFEIRKRYHASRQLLEQDSVVKTLDSQSELYRHKYKRACEVQNSFAQDLFLARLSDVAPRLTIAKEQLEKMILSAKYIKIWD